ncbi:hypothetical protein TrCOL_g7419 [Triparma columacea]|uniref:Uncharacterized protein n=1 Tax=Triparma columacea TaxID=722753 RepID=A0A9W7GBZ1_9STRA|nr:hypothetical protein TrCOL_g7419 [Triparma columacea]
MYADVGINGVRAQVIRASEITEEKGFFGLRKGYNRLFLKKDDVISWSPLVVFGGSFESQGGDAMHDLFLFGGMTEGEKCDDAGSTDTLSERSATTQAAQTPEPGGGGQWGGG